MIPYSGPSFGNIPGAGEQSGLASMYGADLQQQVAALQNATNQRKIQADLQAAQMAAEASRYGAQTQLQAAQAAQAGQTARQQALLDWSKQKFNTFLPYLEQGMGIAGSQAGGGGYGVGMPAMPTAPSFDPAAFMRAAGGATTLNVPTHAPVLTPEQVQQQVNSTVARNQQSTASQVRGAQEQLAGRGFAAGSPLMASIAAQLQGAGMAANANADLQARINAAQLNADQAQKYYASDIQAQAALANAAKAAAASMYNAQVGAGAGIYGSQLDAYNKALALRVQEEQIAQSGKNAIIQAIMGAIGGGLG